MVEKPNVEIEIHSAAACIVTLRGEHDPSTMGQIAGVLNVASAHRHVLVDLSECSFLDSTVVRTLLLAAELAGERGGALEFVAAARSGNAVRRALEVMRVDAVVAVHASRAAGVARFAGAGTQTFGATVDDSSTEAFDVPVGDCAAGDDLPAEREGG